MILDVTLPTIDTSTPPTATEMAAHATNCQTYLDLQLPWLRLLTAMAECSGVSCQLDEHSLHVLHPRIVSSIVTDLRTQLRAAAELRRACYADADMAGHYVDNLYSAQLDIVGFICTAFDFGTIQVIVHHTGPWRPHVPVAAALIAATPAHL